MGPALKVAVLRANALGDFVFALPALEALRAALPGAEIVLLGRAWHAEFLAGRPGPVDRVILVPGEAEPESQPGGRYADAPWLAAPGVEREAFRRAMQAEAFDVAVQIHGGGRNSNPFIAELGARLTIGLRSFDALPLDRWVPFVYYQQEVARCLEVVRLLGAPPVTLEPRLVLTAADLAASREVLPDDDRPMVVLHPGAIDPRRRWPPDRFAAVGEALAGEGMRVVITGGSGEREVGRRISEAMPRPPEDLVARTSLPALAGVLGRARLVVSNDSGPLHLAFALGADTVGVYWCGNLINGGPLTRARHRPAISWRLTCPTCGVDCTRATCPHRVSFVDDVAVDEVLAAAHALLEAPVQPHEPPSFDRPVARDVQAVS